MSGQRPNALAKSLERRLVRAWEAEAAPACGGPGPLHYLIRGTCPACGWSPNAA